MPGKEDVSCLNVIERFLAGRKTRGGVRTIGLADEDRAREGRMREGERAEGE